MFDPQQVPEMFADARAVTPVGQAAQQTEGVRAAERVVRRSWNPLSFAVHAQQCLENDETRRMGNFKVEMTVDQRYVWLGTAEFFFLLSTSI